MNGTMKITVIYVRPLQQEAQTLLFIIVIVLSLLYNQMETKISIRGLD